MLRTSQNSNQNSQLLEAFCNHLSGFVDGEGCFSVSFSLRNRLSVGIECRPSFSLAQKISPKNLNYLQEIRDYFGEGAIRKGDDGCYKYETRKLDVLIKKIIPFFEHYPLQTTKQKDFIIFCKICSRMRTGQHLTPNGLLYILEECKQLNLSGRRKNSLKLLILKVRNKIKKQEN